MATGIERYRGHGVWETLQLKRGALAAARFDNKAMEESRREVVGWLTDAWETKLPRQPSLYLGVLDDLASALSTLGPSQAEFSRFQQNGIRPLADALRRLPPPPPKAVGAAYIRLLDQEVEARTTRLAELATEVSKTQDSLVARQSALETLAGEVEHLSGLVEGEREAIARVSADAKVVIDSEWAAALTQWREDRGKFDEEQNAAILAHAASLAATARAGEALAEHAAGSLSAADWSGRAKRERRAAQWMRFAAAIAFLVAGAVGWFIVSEAIRNNFDLTVGDGILRASVTAVIGAFAVLLLREAGRHFREADTAEDVALSLLALAPFYASSDENVRLAARVNVGDAVLVQNVLSRFAHRDASKRATGYSVDDLSLLVDDATKALGKVGKADDAS